MMSFRLKTMLAFVVVETLLFVILITASLYFLKTTNDHSFTERFESKGRELTVLVRESVLTSDIAVLEELGEHFMSGVEARYLRVRDSHHTLLSKGLDDPDVKPGTPDTSMETVSDGIYDIQNVIYVNDYPVGTIELGMGVQKYTHLIADAKAHLIIFALFGMTLVILTSWLFGVLLTRELRVLREGLREIEQGETDQYLKVRGSSEFREVAEAFNLMSSALFIRQQEREAAELQLIQAKHVAETASQAKSEFLAHITHEIRSPLNALIGCVQLLGDTPLTTSQTKYVHTAEKTSQILLSLINNFLDISRIESGALELINDTFNVVELCESVVEMKAFQLKGRPLELGTIIDPNLPIMLKGDEIRIRQILVNLLDNAAKFTEKGTITIELKAEDVDHERFTLKCLVSDTGIGIPENKQETIFESFSQVDSTDATLHGGAGLGLSICNRLVAAMGGRLELESVVNQGSSFIVTIPLEIDSSSKHADRLASIQSNVDSAAIETPSEPCDSASVKGHILLAEDSVANQMVAIAMLEMAGYTVDVANNGHEVLEKLKQAPFDLILMDMRMPGMGGVEATRYIRESSSSYQAIPIIALTANALKSEQDRCYEAGMNGFIGKPFDREILLNTISEFGVNKHDNNEAINVTETADSKLMDEAVLTRLADETSDAMVSRMITMFVAEAKKRMQLLEQHLNERNCSGVESEAHTLKSNAATFGAAKLAALAKDIEASCKRMDEQRVIELLPETKATLDATLDLYCNRFNIASDE